MQEQGGGADLWQLDNPVQTALFFESPAEIYRRVFKALKPRTALPDIQVQFRRYANANSWIRLAGGILEVRIADVFEGAPAPVQEALAYILISKLYRRDVPAQYSHRYRLYLNRRDVRRQLMLLKQTRGRKTISGPEGDHYNLRTIFEELNQRFFCGLLGCPGLGWSRTPSRTMLGHYDPSHNAIIISRIFDRPVVPRLALDYVMFHEMLHLRFPVEHQRSRRCIHTAEFRKAEKTFPQLKEAKELLKKL